MYSPQEIDNYAVVPENIVKEHHTTIDEKLKESYNYCLDWMAFHSKSFYFASRFLPPDQQKSVAALYAFCRLADDVVDEAAQDKSVWDINCELDRLKKTVTKLANGYTSSNPILHSFGDTIKRHNIPEQYIHELIEGVRMDLNKHHYETEEELDLYMFRVASTVGIMMTHIFMDDPTPQTLARAADLGKAMQLTNILRDIKEDYNMGRIYLPSETRKLFNITDDYLEGETVDEKLISLIRYESERAKSYYRLADLGIEDLPPQAAYTIKVAATVYGEILNEIKRRNYDVLRQRVVVSKFRKILLALKVRLQYIGKF